MLPTYASDMKAWRWLQGPPGPGVPQLLKMRLLALEEQHALVYPAQEEDLRQSLGQRLVPEVPHVDGFKAGEDLVAGEMLQVFPHLRCIWPR